MPRRRISRSKSRAQHWTDKIRAAASGRDAQSVAWDWLLSELENARETRPGRADAACWEMALNVAAYASRLPKARIPPRSGLTAEEIARLLDPWAQDTEEGERQ